MEKTSKPTVAGIFMIVCGALNILGAIFFMVAMGYVIPMMDAMPGYYGMAGYDMTALGEAFIVGGIIGIIFSAFTIISGVYCLKRKVWGLALAGSILAVLQIFILGVPALILVAIAKDEFE